MNTNHEFRDTMNTTNFAIVYKKYLHKSKLPSLTLPSWWSRHWLLLSSDEMHLPFSQVLTHLLQALSIEQTVGGPLNFFALFPLINNQCCGNWISRDLCSQHAHFFGWILSIQRHHLKHRQVFLLKD